jgi:hypothetical protein
VAGEDYTAGHSTLTQPGLIDRAEVSPAKEVQTGRAQYGDLPICRRYRYAAAQQRRLKTVELIVEEVPWDPERTARKGAEMVGVRVECREVSLQRQVKLAGGRRNPAQRVWELRRDQGLTLGLKDRIENAKASIKGGFYGPAHCASHS